MHANPNRNIEATMIPIDEIIVIISPCLIPLRPSAATNGVNKTNPIEKIRSKILTSNSFLLLLLEICMEKYHSSRGRARSFLTVFIRFPTSLVPLNLLHNS